MRAFTELYTGLDETTRTNDKVEALVRYFASVPARDAAWAVYFLSGRKPRQVVGSRQLAAWAIAAAGIPEWLFDECHDAVGDLAEVIALLLPDAGPGSPLPLYQWVEERLLPLQEADVGQAPRPPADEGGAPAEPVAGLPLGPGVDVGRQEQPAAQHGEFVGVEFVVLGLAAVNGLHGEAWPSTKGMP